MPLIHDIQAALLDENASVGAMLLKLRFLAAKLDTDILEEWVKHEAEGYPANVDLPDYRTTKVTYTGTFANIAQQLNNVSIPSALVAKHAGDHWITFQIRDGLPLIDSQLKNLPADSHFGIDCSNLKVLLQDKIYSGMAIVEVNSKIDIGAFARVQHAVRAKTLDFSNCPRCFGRAFQALTVLRIVLNVLAPGLRRAVSTTVRMSASPLAAHMAR